MAGITELSYLKKISYPNNFEKFEQSFLEEVELG
jgi:hypothetical protein